MSVSDSSSVSQAIRDGPIAGETPSSASHCVNKVVLPKPGGAARSTRRGRCSFDANGLARRARSSNARRGGGTRTLAPNGISTP